MLTHQAIFFFRRNKNNNSNDRRFALASIFLSLSLSLSLFSSMFLPLYSFYCQSLLGWHSFLFLSTSSYTNQNFWPIKSLFKSFVAQERKNMCVCMYVVVAFWQVAAVLPEKKNVCAKGRKLIMHFRRLLHDLLISQLKCTYTYGSKGKIGNREFLFPIVVIQRNFSMIN